MSTQVKVAIISSITAIVVAAVPFIFSYVADDNGSNNPEPRQEAMHIRIQAERYDSYSDGTKEGKASEIDIKRPNTALQNLNNGSWVKYNGKSFGIGTNKFRARASSKGSNHIAGKIEVRLENSDGELLGTCKVKDTSNWQTFEEFDCDLIRPISGTNTICLVFREEPGAPYMFNLDWISFTNAGFDIPPINW